MASWGQAVSFLLFLSVLLILGNPCGANDKRNESPSHATPAETDLVHESPTEHGELGEQTDHGELGEQTDNGEHGEQTDSGEHGEQTDNGEHGEQTDHGEHGEHGGEPITTLPIVSWKWSHVEAPYLVALWILVSWLCKLVLELNHHVTKVIPESALLILIGFVLGGIIWGADKRQTFTLTPFNFFFFLLPPIILDAAYFMPNRLFFSNLGTILIHAIIGTCWNAASVGLSLWGCHQGGAMGNLEIGLLQYLLYGSLLAAVDPVAVLAVFEEVHVNEVLFILVFGESLLNDGVTVVLYNVFDAFVSLGGPKINAAEIIKGIVSFFVVAFGGALVGVVFAILLSLLTRYTKNIQIIEAGFIFVLGYLSYLTAEMLSLSAILSITFCGVCCQKYINANMDEKSVTTVRHAMKVLANGSETMVFVFLGISAIDPDKWVWNTGFILLSVLFVLLYRFMGVFFLNWILNKNRLVPIELTDQVVMSFGGLRGAVAFGLAAMLDENKIQEKNLMFSTTLIVVYFTVILQGSTMKPLVRWLKVRTATHKEPKLIEKVNNRTFDHVLTAVEDICGRIGDNWWTRGWNRFENKYICWLLMKPKVRKSKDYIFSIFHKLNLEDAANYVIEGERRGSLAFFRNDDAANIDFKKKFGSDFTEMMPDIMADTSEAEFCIENVPVTSIIQDHVPTISLNMHEEEMNGMPQDFNAHHLLHQHLYKSRKHHRHRYSRSNFSINQNEDEVQEIFQRTMRSRLESFKSAKMGITPTKTITKHPKKEQQQRMSNGNSAEKINRYSNEDLECSGSDGGATGGNYPMAPRYTVGAGIENPAFMPEMDTPPLMHSPPWLSEAEAETTVAPSQRAQRQLPWTPSNLRRLAPLRISNRSTDSFLMADIPPPPPPPEPEPEEPPRGGGTRM